MPSLTSAYPAYPNPYPYPKQASSLFTVAEYAKVLKISPVTLIREIYGRIRIQEEHKNMKFRVHDIARAFETNYKKFYRCMVDIDELLTREDLIFRFNVTKRQIQSRKYPHFRHRNIVRYYAQETIDFHLRRYA